MNQLTFAHFPGESWPACTVKWLLGSPAGSSVCAWVHIAQLQKTGRKQTVVWKRIGRYAIRKRVKEAGGWRATGEPVLHSVQRREVSCHAERIQDTGVGRKKKKRYDMSLLFCHINLLHKVRMHGAVEDSWNDGDVMWVFYNFLHPCRVNASRRRWHPGWE